MSTSELFSALAMQDSIEVSASALQALADEVRALRLEVRRLSGRRQELPRLQALADELGVAPRTVYRKLEKHEIPIRDSHGYPKEEGDRSASHVSRMEWEARERRDTRSVRKAAGMYDS